MASLMNLAELSAPESQEVQAAEPEDMVVRQVAEAMTKAGDLYRYVGVKTHEHKAIPN